MSVMFILLPLALLLAGVALLVFIWAARTGQFDDLETPALRILHEDVEVRGAVDGVEPTVAAPRGRSSNVSALPLDQ
jgi:cbb3-type cytochrome oxidase maturation protein